MNLSLLYQTWKQDILQQVRDEGRDEARSEIQRLWVENLLKFRFSKLDEELSLIVERLLPLPYRRMNSHAHSCKPLVKNWWRSLVIKPSRSIRPKFILCTVITCAFKVSGNRTSFPKQQILFGKSYLIPETTENIVREIVPHSRNNRKYCSGNRTSFPKQQKILFGKSYLIPETTDIVREIVPHSRNNRKYCSGNRTSFPKQQKILFGKSYLIPETTENIVREIVPHSRNNRKYWSPANLYKPGVQGFLAHLREENSMESQWLKWAKKLQALSQNGLTFSENPYEIERYQAIREIALEIMAEGAKADITELRDIFSQEIGYATPKVDVRGVVFRDDALLFVKERSDGCWALPGGWADVVDTPSKAVTREIYEESGYQTRAVKLLAVYDRSKQGHRPQYPFHVYKMFFLCELLGGRATTSIETDDIAFFREDEIPELSKRRVTPAQVTRMFEYYRHPEWPADFD